MQMLYLRLKYIAIYSTNTTSNGSPFVHHSKKCSAFIVEEQQLKVCYRLYLQSIVH